MVVVPVIDLRGTFEGDVMSNDRLTMPDLRVPVADHLQPMLKMYRRLWMSIVDLQEARAAVDEILRARIPIPRKDRPPPLLMALTSAVVVAYARPWVHSRGHSFADRSVPASLLRGLTSRQRQLHDFLIEVRNQDIAHADIDESTIALWLTDNDDRALVWWTRRAFRRWELLDIRRLTIKVEKAMSDRCAELRAGLPHEQWI